LVPTFRADLLLDLTIGEYTNVIDQLSAIEGVEIRDLSRFLDVCERRIQYFHSLGCRQSDVSLERALVGYKYDYAIASLIFKKLLEGSPLSNSEIGQFQFFLLIWLGQKYSEFGWVMQIHAGALRNVNTHLSALIGFDAGFDGVGDTAFVTTLAAILNSLSGKESLPKTILYVLDPTQYDATAILAGCFTNERSSPHVQLGPAWWFNDNYFGIRKLLETIASHGVLHDSVGMTTDSRSFLSFSRHEFFRRVLCSTLSNWSQLGLISSSKKDLEQLLKNICFTNAKNLFHETTDLLRS
jgi:glucuronate isomerase